MVSNGRLLSAMAGCLLISAMSGCHAQVPAEQPEPTLNPSPKHIIRVHGRLPERFVTDWRVSYVTHNDKDPSCQVGSEWGPHPARQMVPLELNRSGNKYEASLVVDRYLPGKCEWRLHVSDAAVAQAGNSTDEGATDGPLIDARRMRVSDDVPRCGRRSQRCTEEHVWRRSNDKPTPVIVRCRSSRADENRSKQENFTCQDPFYDRSKMQHLVKADTSVIEINFYDLDNEPDPVGTYKNAQGGARDE